MFTMSRCGSGQRKPREKGHLSWDSRRGSHFFSIFWKCRSKSMPPHLGGLFTLEWPLINAHEPVPTFGEAKQSTAFMGFDFQSMMVKGFVWIPPGFKQRGLSRLPGRSAIKDPSVTCVTPQESSSLRRALGTSSMSPSHDATPTKLVTAKVYFWRYLLWKVCNCLVAGWKYIFSLSGALFLFNIFLFPDFCSSFFSFSFSFFSFFFSFFFWSSFLDHFALHFAFWCHCWSIVQERVKLWSFLFLFLHLFSSLFFFSKYFHKIFFF